jgi:hypothetical protein
MTQRTHQKIEEALAAVARATEALRSEGDMVEIEQEFARLHRLLTSASLAAARIERNRRAEWPS